MQPELCPLSTDTLPDYIRMLTPSNPHPITTTIRQPPPPNPPTLQPHPITTTTPPPSRPQDGDFSEERFRNIVNANLANDVGNLLNRTLNLLKKNCAATLPLDAAAVPADNPLRWVWVCLVMGGWVGVVAGVSGSGWVGRRKGEIGVGGAARLDVAASGAAAAASSVGAGGSECVGWCSGGE